MRHAAAFIAALASTCVAGCNRPTAPSRLRPIPLAIVLPDAPPPTRPPPIAGAAAAPTHPNENNPDESLGQRISPRTIALPHVSLGQSRTFTFDGDRRGWVLQLAEGGTLATPAYANGKVYVGAGFTSGTVYALDAHTGSQSWQGATPDGGPTAAIIDDDKVLFNTESCTLFAFDLRTGRQRWSRWLGDPLMSQPAASHGRVFSAYPSAASPTGFRFAALSMRTGDFVWSRPITADVITAPVIDGDAVFATTMNGMVYRFDAATGHRVWIRSVGATSAPAVHAGRVFVAQRARGGRERQLVLAADTGSIAWRGETVTAPYAAERADTGGTVAGWSFEGSRPTYADGRLYYAMGDQLVARDAQNGNVAWQRRYPHSVVRRGMTSPSIVGGSLVVATRDGKLFGMDIDTGSTVWAYDMDEPMAFQPTVANGWVYAATASGKVIGLELADRTMDGWHMWGGNPQHNGVAAHEHAPVAVEPRPSRGVLHVHAGSDERPFPLVRTRMAVTVSGFVARVEVEQEFENPFDRTLDAEYLFPLPGDSAVDSMDLYVGARETHATIQPRAQARTTYANARACGLHAALLEQQRADLFKQSVANVRAGERVRVVLRFAATVPFHDGAYELALPLASGSQPGVADSGARNDGIDLAVAIDMGTTLAEVASPSHAVTVSRDDATRASVHLTHDAVSPDRDFVLRYRPEVNQAAPAVLADRGDDGEGVFTFALHPEAHVEAGAIAPREMVFLLDSSSSMRGAPLEQARTLLHRAIDRLRPNDRFRVVAFSDHVASLSALPLAPTSADLIRAHAFIDGIQAAGSTDMLPVVHETLTAAPDRARLRFVVLLTDGFLGNDRTVLAAVDRDLGLARVFTFGVGSRSNHYLLQQLAELGRGHSESVLPTDDAVAAADRFYAHVDRPYLTDVRVDWGTLPVHDVYPRYVPDLFADRPVLLHGRYASAAESDVRVTGRLAGRLWSRTIHVRLPEHARDHEALRSVWARARVADLARVMLLGETPALENEVTALGLANHLVTDYTAFVAVDTGDPAARGSCARVAAPSAGMFAAGTGYGGGGSGYGYGSANASLVGQADSFGYGSALRSRSAASVPLIRAEPPILLGMVPPEVLRRTVRRNLFQVQRCYERALPTRPRLQGRIETRLVIGPEGNVLGAVASADSMGAPDVTACVLGAVRAWHFPPLPDGESIVTMTYPFVFSPADEPHAPAVERFQVPLDPGPP